MATPALPAVAADLRELAGWQALLQACGARPVHAARVLRQWLNPGVGPLPGTPPQAGCAEAAAPRRPGDLSGSNGPRGPSGPNDSSGPRGPRNPAGLEQAMPALREAWAGLARVCAEAADAQGDARLLVALGDGERVEAVLLPRGGVCISAQAGCAVGCTFCMTGRGGLRRQLGSAEMVAQVVLARRRRAVRKVVFMGMGEPAHNLDAVLEAIDLLAGAGGIGHKNLVISTVGDARLIERLQARCGTPAPKPALAWSLHTTDAARRRALLPRAPAIDLPDWMAAADRYARASGYPLQVQWTLLEGINDGPDEAEGIVALLRGRHAMLNLIPWNSVAGAPHARPARARIEALARAVGRGGVLTRVRWSAAQTVEGGCGQLHARTPS